MEEKPTRIEIEETFHDGWAKSMKMDELDIYAAFTAKTTPEFHFALEALGDLKGKDLLDAGCGPGEASVFLARQGANVIGVDISSEMIKVAQNLAKEFEVESTQLQFQQMSVEDLLFADESFHVVFGSNLMHHCDVNIASKELARVLRPGGRAVFVDPLGYNPIINIYRKMAFKVRTPTEHPLVFSDLDIMRKYYRKVTHKEFQLFTLLIFIWFFFIERIHPNSDRYWRKFVLEQDRYSRVFLQLYKIDQVFLKWVPVLRRLCWNIVTICEK